MPKCDMFIHLKVTEGFRDFLRKESKRLSDEEGVSVKTPLWKVCNEIQRELEELRDKRVHIIGSRTA